MKIKEASHWPVNIYMAGNIDTATNVCSEFCDEVGLCVRLYESFYVYTGGAETGFTVSFINYPRFPLTTNEIDLLAQRLGKKLLVACGQTSFSIETPDITTWFSNREEDNETVSQDSGSI